MNPDDTPPPLPPAMSRAAVLSGGPCISGLLWCAELCDGIYKPMLPAWPLVR